MLDCLIEVADGLSPLSDSLASFALAGVCVCVCVGVGVHVCVWVNIAVRTREKLFMTGSPGIHMPDLWLLLKIFGVQLLIMRPLSGAGAETLTAHSRFGACCSCCSCRNRKLLFEMD